jgi:hypothetical protein
MTLSEKRHMFEHAAVHKFSYNVWATSSFLAREGVTRSKFRTEDRQIFISTVQGLVARATGCPWFVYPWLCVLFTAELDGGDQLQDPIYLVLRKEVPVPTVYVAR